MRGIVGMWAAVHSNNLLDSSCFIHQGSRDYSTASSDSHSSLTHAVLVSWAKALMRCMDGWSSDDSSGACRDFRYQMIWNWMMRSFQGEEGISQWRLGSMSNNIVVGIIECGCCQANGEKNRVDLIWTPFMKSIHSFTFITTIAKRYTAVAGRQTLNWVVGW